MGFLFMEIYRGDIPGPQDFKSCTWWNAALPTKSRMRQEKGVSIAKVRGRGEKGKTVRRRKDRGKYARQFQLAGACKVASYRYIRLCRFSERAMGGY